MSEIELLAAISKKLTRNEAYKFVRNTEHVPFIERTGHNQKVRLLVSRYFELRPEHIVHHEDRDQNNNTLSNLRVFASNGAHTRYHKKFDAKPIWNGAEIA